MQLPHINKHTFGEPMSSWKRNFWDIYQVSTFNLDEEYKENFIKNYRAFYKATTNAHVLNCKEIKTLKNTNTKCYFGRGSHPVSISSWQVKTNALLYDMFIFDFTVFRQTVTGAIPPNLHDDKILDYIDIIDLEASNFLIELYKNGYVKLVNSPYIWNNMFSSDKYTSLEKEKKLYTDKKEIEKISREAALFPGDEYNYPGLLQLMNEDIMASYLTDSSIITREYSGYIKRKLDNINQTISKHSIVDHLLKYEVPNFDVLDYKKINDIRSLSSLSKFREKIEESSQNIVENSSSIEETVQSFRDELWELALDNIEDNKSKIIVESLISNFPILSYLFSARDLLKVSKLQKHWGYTILQLKKNKGSSLKFEEKSENHENLASSNLVYDISLRLDDYISSASSNYYQDKYEEELKIYEEAIEINPEDSVSWYNKGNLLASNFGQYLKAIECFDVALKINPSFDIAWVCKGSAYGDLEEHHEAIKCFDEAIKINPNNSSAWSNKGSALCNLGRLEDSLEAYNVSLKISSENGFVWCMIGNVYNALNDKNAALEAYNKAVELNPHLSPVISKIKDSFSIQK